MKDGCADVEAAPMLHDDSCMRWAKAELGLAAIGPDREETELTSWLRECIIAVAGPPGAQMPQSE